MKLSSVREHLRHIWLGFVRYRRGFLYLYMRYGVAPKIVRVSKILERPITRNNLSMHMLFGHRDFLMALWSLASFYRVSSLVGKLYLHSDGTLGATEIQLLKRFFPNAVYVDARNVVGNYKNFFETHPDLQKFRTIYPKFQAKKLLDPYLVSEEPYRLVLDSDILWFQDPVEIKNALDSGVPEALMMSDGGGELAYVTFKDGSQVSEEVASFNSGIVLYKKEQFHLGKFSEYLAKVDYLRTRFTDQACYASIFLPSLRMLPPERYIIKGTLIEKIVARHYTNPQRAKFFLYGLNFIWKDILSPS